jgi:hypothetical protein
MHARRPGWFWLVILAVLFTRLAGVHLHFCFDGQERQATMHTVDGSIHNDADHVDSEHTDQDVDVFDALLAKLGERAFNLPLLFAVALVLLPPLGRLSRDWLRAATDPVPHLTPPRLRPPLRGPPR